MRKMKKAVGTCLAALTAAMSISVIPTEANSVAMNYSELWNGKGDVVFCEKSVDISHLKCITYGENVVEVDNYEVTGAGADMYLTFKEEYLNSLNLDAGIHGFGICFDGKGEITSGYKYKYNSETKEIVVKGKEGSYVSEVALQEVSGSYAAIDSSKYQVSSEKNVHTITFQEEYKDEVIKAGGVRVQLSGEDWYRAVQLFKGVKGDTDQSGSVDIRDAQKILQIALKIYPGTYGVWEYETGDVDGDKELTLTDAQKILRHALRIETDW